MKFNNNKVLFVYNPHEILKYDGIILQLKNWANYLKKKIKLKIFLKKKISNFNNSKYYAIHFFGHNRSIFSDVSLLRNKRIIWSPIMDPKFRTFFIYKIISFIPFELFGIHQNHRQMYLLQKKIYKFSVRSKKEMDLLLNIRINKNKIKKTLIQNIIQNKIKYTKLKKKRLNKSVLHVSILDHKRKNVKNLISICVKNNFNLTLVGTMSSITNSKNKFNNYLKDICKKNKNIKYLGNLDTKELSNLMLNHKVFCLPSLFEGVGQSALDAAYHGMQIVSTDNTGLKDYLGNNAHYIHPHDNDKIAQKINFLISNFKINLSGHKKMKNLNENYNKKEIVDLINLYQN